jgi:hypothetical protein
VYTELASQFDVIDNALKALSWQAGDETGANPVPQVEQIPYASETLVEILVTYFPEQFRVTRLVFDDVACRPKFPKRLVLRPGQVPDVKENLNVTVKDFLDSRYRLPECGQHASGLAALEQHYIYAGITDCSGTPLDIFAAHEEPVIVLHIVATHRAIITVHATDVGDFDYPADHDVLAKMFLAASSSLGEKLLLLLTSHLQGGTDFGTTQSFPTHPHTSVIGVIDIHSEIPRSLLLSSRGDRVRCAPASRHRASIALHCRS